VRLTEDRAKDWLRAYGLPIPDGAVAETPSAAYAAAERLGGAVAVKALVAVGRRGKAGAVRMASSPEEAAEAASAMIGREIAESRVEKVYVERRAEIARELYFALSFGISAPEVVLSVAGGIEIEDTFARDPSAVIRASIDPRRGLLPWNAVELWKRAGISGALLPALAEIAARLYDAFRAADALTLEVNPLALDAAGAPLLVGALMEIDDGALFRHKEWAPLADGAGEGGRKLNEREAAVVAADRRFPGGAVRYSELEGDIGLMVAGGGASLLQHDMIVAAGGRPANHSDISPTPTPEKPAAVFDAIFSNPRTRSLLIGYNHLQMARCDNVIAGLLIAAKKHRIDPRRFPIVVRLFGPGEDEARRLAETLPGIQYLARGSSLADGVRAIVETTRRATGASGAATR
jgi:succinyl-CoA synthetase beta subunit/citryl-CoA synthetase large subunit